MVTVEKGQLKSVINPNTGDVYTINKVLGAGGFGITYSAVVSRKLRRVPCALKEYMPEAIASRDTTSGEIVPDQKQTASYRHGRKRFLEEAELLKKLRIPGIVRVYDYFETNGTAYYSMELLKGSTLRQIMRAKDGKLPFESVLGWIVLTANALDTLHKEAGVFHRDISPENIILMPDGSIKIIDFGCAKLMDIKEKQNYSVVLKPGFAPPEQYASNMSQGSFTDVYALAGTFYFLATGVMIPAAPDRLMGAAYKPLASMVPECTRQISDAVDHALKIDARFRTQTMHEFMQELGITPRTAEKTARTEKNFRTGKTADAEPSVTVEDNSGEKGIKMQSSSAVLVVTKGESQSTRYPVPFNEFVGVGRSRTKSSIVVFSAAREVSQLHCQVEYSPAKGVFHVIDQSTNGTYYKGTRLEKGKKYGIRPGTELELGSAAYRIRLDLVK